MPYAVVQYLVPDSWQLPCNSSTINEDLAQSGTKQLLCKMAYEIPGDVRTIAIRRLVRVLPYTPTYLLQEDRIRAVRIDCFDSVVGIRIYRLSRWIKALDQVDSPIDQARRLHTPPGRHVLSWEAKRFSPTVGSEEVADDKNETIDKNFSKKRFGVPQMRRFACSRLGSWRKRYGSQLPAAKAEVDCLLLLLLLASRRGVGTCRALPPDTRGRLCHPGVAPFPPRCHITEPEEHYLEPPPFFEETNLHRHEVHATIVKKKS